MDTYTAVGGLQSPPVPDGSRNMNSNLIFEKATEEKLSSAITRLYYMVHVLSHRSNLYFMLIT